METRLGYSIPGVDEYMSCKTIASRTRYTNYKEKNLTDGKDLVNKNVLSCLLKDGKEVNAVMLVGRLGTSEATSQ